MNSKLFEEVTSKPLSELPNLVEQYSASELSELSKEMERFSLNLIRIASYLDSRCYDMNDHDGAVKEQNKLIAKVRRAMGFSYPKQDIHF